VSQKYGDNPWVCGRKRQSTEHPVAKILQNTLMLTAKNHLKKKCEWNMLILA
jgi:hypothetical protein